MTNLQDDNPLLKSISLYKQIIKSIYNHVVITDTEGKILFTNPSAEKITGYTSEEMIGNNPRLWGGLMGIEFYNKLWKTIKTDKKPFHGEVQNKRKNGRKYFAIATISPILDDKNNLLGFFAIEEDITEIKELDMRKTEFLSIASHQLRTPLGSMRWNMEMLLEGEFGKIQPNIRTIIDQLYNSNLRMITLVNDLLSVTRIEQGRVFDEPVSTDIEKLIRSVAAEIESEAQKKGITGELHFAKESIPNIFIDPKRLREVLQNLLSNAIKYNRKKGRVIVRVTKHPDHIKITVSDNGIGIPEKDKEKLFTKYFRADNAVKFINDGTGLGLFIVKSYVEAWGGKVWIEADPDEGGTTISFTLPFEPKSGTLSNKLNQGR